MDQLNNRAYRDQWKSVNASLESIRIKAGLGAALRHLMRHQVASGFIQDELREIVRYQLPCPFEPARAFSAQYNPARARRFDAASPSGPSVPAVNNGCFLCPENVQWQHQGAEIGFELPHGQGCYIAWMNPYPLLPGHTIVASRQHRPQHWAAPGARALAELTTDLVALAQDLPGWIGFYNGVGAGASIPHHQHFHFLPRAPGYEEMPLERAARQSSGATRIEERYPLSFMHWGGRSTEVLATALGWLEHWQQGNGSLADATANIIACARADSSGLDLYFIPRHQARSRAEGLQGVIGGFETLGEIVCSSVEEKRRLDSGQVDFQAVAAMLRQVSTAF
ncbi:MAG: DUF4922 domain-containing protein [Wenzhouxiangella sp.]